MPAKRPLRRGAGAAIGLIALVSFAAPTPVLSGAGDVEAEPFVGPEQPVARAVQGVPHSAQDPVVAFGGSISLVVWTDAYTNREPAVMATRVSRAGEVLDRSSISLSGGRGGADPSVAFDGTNFLVVWASFVQVPEILAVRVSPQGTVLDPAPIELSNLSTHGALRPSVSFDGIGHLVVWANADDGSTFNIHGARVRPDGTIVEPGEFVVTDVLVHSDEPAIAFNGTDHLLVWQAFNGTDRDVYGSLLTAEGVALTPGGVPISAAVGDQDRPAITAVGARFFVAWTDRRSGTGIETFGTRVSRAGAALDPAGIRISRSPQPDVFEGAAVASDGRTVLVLWEGGSEVRAARIAPSGAVVDPDDLLLPQLFTRPAAAFDGENYLVGGIAHGPTLVTRVTRQGVALDPAGIVVSLTSNRQHDIAMAFDGTNQLVVWADDRDPVMHAVRGGPVYGARVGPDGQVLDGTGFAISTSDHDTSPVVAFDGSNYLVVWTNAAGASGPDQPPAVTRAARVSPAGEVLDRFDIAVGGMLAPEVAFGGGVFLLTWTVASAEDVGVYAARVAPDGTVLDPEGFRLSDGWAAWGLSVTFGSSDFLVTWAGAGFDVAGARVSPAGVVLDPGGFPIASSPLPDLSPSVAWQDGVYLVAWQHVGPEIEPEFSDIWGARVDEQGTVLDPAGIAISDAPGEQSAPTVAANGPFLVTWTDRRRLDTDVFASRVDLDGTVAHPDGFAIAGSATDELGAAVAPTGHDRIFRVAYDRFAPETPYGTERAFIRTVSPK